MLLCPRHWECQPTARPNTLRVNVNVSREHSLQASVPCGVAATLAGVPSEDLAEVACEMEGGTRAGTIGLSARLGVRALTKTYGVRVLW